MRLLPAVSMMGQILSQLKLEVPAENFIQTSPMSVFAPFGLKKTFFEKQTSVFSFGKAYRVGLFWHLHFVPSVPWVCQGRLLY